MARCPHCQTVLPEAATFCGACGRRIEGWSALPAPAAGGQALPGGEEPTRQVTPTPSLLRAAALSKARDEAGRQGQAAGRQGQAAGRQGQAAQGWQGDEDAADEDEPEASRRPPLWLMLMLVAAGAAGLGYWAALRARAPRLALPPVSAAPGAPASPVTAPAPPVTAPAPPVTAPAPLAAAQQKSLAAVQQKLLAAVQQKSPPTLPKPAVAATQQKERRRGPLRAEPLVLPAKAPRSPSALPHKAVATDSKPLPPGAPGATPSATQSVAAPSVPAAQPVAVAPADPDAPTAATPRTDEELEHEAQASLDADGIRFVVKSHLTQVHACYERAFKNASPGGRVEIGLAITAGGRAERVRVESNSTDSEALGHCLVERVQKWQFPRPVGGDYELIYPFVFAPGS